MNAVVIAPFYEVRSDGRVYHDVGECLVLEEDKALRWYEQGLVKILDYDVCGEEFPWGSTRGRELEVLEDRPGGWRRVVACLNVWQDLHELKRTIDSWYPHVDHVIAVDGAYADLGPWADRPESTDGTAEFLRGLSKVEFVRCKGWWPDQMTKRTEYMKRGQPGDLLFVVDADEYVDGADALRDLPYMDVGWVSYLAPNIYSRPQGFPRLFRWVPGLEYRGRHHWVWVGDRLLTTCQRGGVGWDMRAFPRIVVHNSRGDYRLPSRRVAALQGRARQATRERQAAAGLHHDVPTEPLRIVQLGNIDAGMVIYRLHSAINTTTPHESLMATRRHDRPFEEPYQWCVKEDRTIVQQALLKTDVVHCHLEFNTYHAFGHQPNVWVVIHHHGSMLRGEPHTWNDRDLRYANMSLVSNLELLRYGSHRRWLPNPVPVARYKRMGDGVGPEWDERPFRVCHTPTRRAFKGTDALLEAVENLRRRGIDIAVDLVENATHRDSLHAKARAHVTFDSFWLGIQCAGLEAGAMGRPVIAGDREVADRYRDMVGAVPYTYANDRATLEKVLERLATDRQFYGREARRVWEYVREYHDYAAVSARYLRLLDGAVGWIEHHSLDAWARRKRGATV